MRAPLLEDSPSPWPARDVETCGMLAVWREVAVAGGGGGGGSGTPGGRASTGCNGWDTFGTDDGGINRGGRNADRGRDALPDLDELVKHVTCPPISTPLVSPSPQPTPPPPPQILLPP